MAKLIKNTKLLSSSSSTQARAGHSAKADAGDYRGMYPKIGLETGYTEALINADFKYSIGTDNSSSFSFIDKNSKHVVYYTAMTPTGMSSVFKAYRYSFNESFIYEPEPLSLTFLAPNERLHYFINVGTNFIVAVLVSTELPKRTTRIVIVRTNGSSVWTDWTFAYDVTSLETNTTNYALVGNADSEYILRISGANPIKLDVFDSGFTLLRTQVLYSLATDVDLTDRTTSGRTGITSMGFGYNAYGRTPGFTWNPFTQSLHFRHACYNVVNNANGSKTGVGYSMTFAWSMPYRWIALGEGAPENLIPVKSDGFRYRAYSDATWNTYTGGIAQGDTSVTTCFVTDEYSGDIHVMSRVGRNNATGGSCQTYEKSDSPLLTVSTYVTDRKKFNFALTLPDGSPYAKGFATRHTFVIGNSLFVYGKSLQNASLPMVLDFSTTSFSSVVTANDTLNFEPDSIVRYPFSVAVAPANGDFGAMFSTVVKNGAGRYFLSKPNTKILEATKPGERIEWSALNIVFPTIPTMVDGLRIVSHGAYVWNSDLVNPVFYAFVKTNTYFRVIKYASGAWTVASADIAVSQVNIGNASRGDMLYSGSVTPENCLLTESGKMMFSLHYPVTGNTIGLTIVYNTLRQTFTEKSMLAAFTAKPAPAAMYPYAAMYDTTGGGYGYCDVFGYYALRAPLDISNFKFICSKDPTGVGAELTEEEWITKSKGFHYEITGSASSAVGLVAYLSEYPVFLGGYHTKIPQTTVPLRPSQDNYIFATKGTSSRDDVAISVDSIKLSNTFSRICLAKVTTSQDKVLSSELYSIDGVGLPSQEGKSGLILSTNGKSSYWKENADTAQLLQGPTNALGNSLKDLLDRVNLLETKTNAM